MGLIKVIGFVRLTDLIMVINLVMNIESEKRQTTNYKPRSKISIQQILLPYFSKFFQSRFPAFSDICF